MKRLLWLLCILTIAILVVGTDVRAETGVRYHTFTMSENRLVRTQTAYVPIATINEIGGHALVRPRDIHIDANDIIYIATQNPERTYGKIIVYNMNTDDVRVLGTDFLQEPFGVFANKRGEIYVADHGNNIAYHLSPDGDILQTFTRPDSPLFGAGDFRPRKIIADTRGNVYILNLGVRGLAQFSHDGEFLGYFGTNTVQPTLRTILQQTFFTEEQRARLFNVIPAEITNMAIDNRGLIHTVSSGVEGVGVKRLNLSGGNVLPSMFNARDLVDVFVGPIGNIYVVTASGYIFEYDIEGNLLFMFGGQDGSNVVQGLFNTPSAIAVDSAFNVYVLDRLSEEMKIFYPTEFTNLVHTALEQYQDGDYVASQEPWERVLKMNDFFDLAHRGLGNAYYSLGQYDEALEEFYIASDRDGYSDAFWEVRNAWLLANVGSIIAALFVVLIALTINIKVKFMPYIMSPVKKAVRLGRDKSKTFDEILYVFTYLKNPADASYFIKRKNRVSTFSATVLLMIYFLCYVYYIYNLNFLFNPRRLADINMVEEVIKVFLPILLWVGCNFLVGSIREGEGRLRDVYTTTIYALAPFFIVLPVLAIMSNGLTYNEAFLITFIQGLSILMTAIYFFFMVKETHFYTVKETFSSLLISAFTMVMLLLGVVIVYVLLNELFVLLQDLTLEVYYRVFHP